MIDSNQIAPKDVVVEEDLYDPTLRTDLSF